MTPPIDAGIYMCKAIIGVLSLLFGAGLVWSWGSRVFSRNRGGD